MPDLMSDLSHELALPDDQIIAQLLAGDEQTFETVVAHYYPMMLRLARLYVPVAEIAQDVIQETWIGVLRGLPNFQRRSSLKTWIFSILINRAKTLARREGRYVDSLSLDEDEAEPVVSPECFRPADDPQWPHHWAQPPYEFGNVAEDQVIANEISALVEGTINRLPPMQREVILLRDFQYWSSEEICQLLEISEANQRVLLHRARSKIRQILEDYLKGD